MLTAVPGPLHAQRSLPRSQGVGDDVAATIRTVFAQPDATNAKEQWRRVADSFKGPLSPPGGAYGRGGSRRAGVRDIPIGTLEADLVEQSAGAGQLRRSSGART